MKEKNPLSHGVVCYRCLILRPKNLILRSQKQIRRKLLLSRKLCHFRAGSHNVLYYQPLPITRYQVGFYANNHFK